ncbi:hypothetical protein COHA_009757 [Chlorella ohadii]|uniref:Uncharacterized protein n=1 Tax=Chlorella ohadii TaxID=2649997 RepID=A0AAD5DHL8_9CHLO|nr:hypothetical protein COHA_009757 [Chlorella ohadii]
MKHCFFSQHIDSSKLPIDSLTTRVASPMSHLTVARALSACSAAAPPRQRYTSSHVQQRLAGGASWLAAGLCRRRQCRHRTAAGLFGGLFGGGSSSGSGNDEELQPLENDEGGLMVALDANSSGSLDGSSEEPFGPLALLAVGFAAHEFERLQRLLHEEMEAEMVKLVPASVSMLEGSLGAALEREPVPAFEQAPLGTRRVVFLSGMYAAEVMETISAFREAGLPETVFAAAVPNNWERVVGELVQEVYADHAAMKRQRQQQQQRQ